MMSKPLYIPSRIFFVLFFFSRSRHRCRLYTCKICTFYMPFFSLLHFLKGKMLPEHFEFRQDIHYFRTENGRNWSGKRWVFGVFQWILPSMRLVHLCLQTTSFGKRKVPVRAFDSNCAVTHIGLVKTLRHLLNRMAGKIWAERVVRFAYANKVNTLRMCRNIIA